MSALFFETKDLAVGYNGHPLIREISLALHRGEILTLIGPNGAGKTTLIKTLIRQLAPIHGVSVLQGREMQQMEAKELARQLSVMLTDRIKTELLTCRDVVEAGRYPYTGRFGVLSPEDRRVVEDVMDLVQVRDLAEQDFSTLSDGQRQRVLLARALCQEPELLVLDEPTSYLDVRFKTEFLSLLQRLVRERKLTVILSLHELDLAERISDRILCLKGDHVDRIGTPEEVFVPGYIEALYGMQENSFDVRTGVPELAVHRTEDAPRTFVLAGAGFGTFVFRGLQRRGIPFVTGILWENDVDYPAAKALAAQVISVPAFDPIGEEQVQKACQLMESCSRLLLALPEERLLGAAEPLKRLVQKARELDLPVVTPEEVQHGI